MPKLTRCFIINGFLREKKWKKWTPISESITSWTSWYSENSIRPHAFKNNRLAFLAKDRPFDILTPSSSLYFHFVLKCPQTLTPFHLRQWGNLWTDPNLWNVFRSVLFTFIKFTASLIKLHLLTNRLPTDKHQIVNISLTMIYKHLCKQILSF